jgi:hypothetical protein
MFKIYDFRNEGTSAPFFDTLKVAQNVLLYDMIFLMDTI